MVSNHAQKITHFCSPLRLLGRSPLFGRNARWTENVLPIAIQPNAPLRNKNTRDQSCPAFWMSKMHGLSKMLSLCMLCYVICITYPYKSAFSKHACSKSHPAKLTLWSVASVKSTPRRQALLKHAPFNVSFDSVPTNSRPVKSLVTYS